MLITNQITVEKVLIPSMFSLFFWFLMTSINHLLVLVPSHVFSFLKNMVQNKDRFVVPISTVLIVVTSIYI